MPGLLSLDVQLGHIVTLLGVPFVLEDLGVVVLSLLDLSQCVCDDFVDLIISVLVRVFVTFILLLLDDNSWRFTPIA